MSEPTGPFQTFGPGKGASAAAGFGATASRNEAAPVIARLSAVLATVELDCGCRSKLADALTRFSDLEHLRERRQHLLDAREQVGRITALLDFLNELHEIGVNEADRSVFAEIAQLFEDVAGAARQGAEDMRRLAT